MGRPSARDWFLLFALGLVWGSSFLGVEIALRDLGPVTVAAGRLAVAALIMVPFAILSGRPPPSFSGQGRLIWLFALGSALASQAVPFSLLAWGQQHIDSGLVGLSLAMTPLFTLALGHFLTSDERMTGRKALGVAVGFAGAALLIAPKIGGSALGDLGDLALAGQAACISAGLFYALGAITVRRAPKTDPLSFSSAAILLSALILVPAAVMIEGTPTFQSGSGALPAILILGAFNTALAALIMFTLIASAGAGFFSFVNYQIPAWAVVLGVLFLGERLAASSLLAMILILAGVAISQSQRRN